MTASLRIEVFPADLDRSITNELGLRNVCLEVDDLQASTTWPRTDTDWSAASASTRAFGAWPTSRGPEGIVESLAERIG